MHTEPNFSLPWQRKRQYSSSSSGFMIQGHRILTNAHCVDHATQARVKRSILRVACVACGCSRSCSCDAALRDVGDNVDASKEWSAVHDDVRCSE